MPKKRSREADAVVPPTARAPDDNRSADQKELDRLAQRYLELEMLENESRTRVVECRRERQELQQTLMGILARVPNSVHITYDAVAGTPAILFAETKTRRQQAKSLELRSVFFERLHQQSGHPIAAMETLWNEVTKELMQEVEEPSIVVHRARGCLSQQAAPSDTGVAGGPVTGVLVLA